MSLMLIRGKKSMLQPSDDSNHIYEPTNKTNIQHFLYLNWKSEFVIYLMECILCKIQHVGKTEMTFNLILSNHSKGTKKPDSILACKHFQQKGHNFNKHAKFIITDELINLHAPKETLVELLVGRENF